MTWLFLSAFVSLMRKPVLENHISVSRPLAFTSDRLVEQLYLLTVRDR